MYHLIDKFAPFAQDHDQDEAPPPRRLLDTERVSLSAERNHAAR